MTPITETLLTIRIPMDAESIAVVTFGDTQRLVYATKEPYDKKYPSWLPEGNYKLLGTCTSSGADFDASKLVICLGEFEGSLWYMDYSKPDDSEDCALNSWTKSFISLLTSKGIDLSNNSKIAILKKLN